MADLCTWADVQRFEIKPDHEVSRDLGSTDRRGIAASALEAGSHAPCVADGLRQTCGATKLEAARSTSQRACRPRETYLALCPASPCSDERS
jgi:hypothetical protein